MRKSYPRNPRTLNNHKQYMLVIPQLPIKQCGTSLQLFFLILFHVVTDLVCNSIVSVHHTVDAILSKSNHISLYRLSVAFHVAIWYCKLILWINMYNSYCDHCVSFHGFFYSFIDWVIRQCLLEWGELLLL